MPPTHARARIHIHIHAQHTYPRAACPKLSSLSSWPALSPRQKHTVLWMWTKLIMRTLTAHEILRRKWRAAKVPQRTVWSCLWNSSPTAGPWWWSFLWGPGKPPGNLSQDTESHFHQGLSSSGMLLGAETAAGWSSFPEACRVVDGKTANTLGLSSQWHSASPHALFYWTAQFRGEFYLFFSSFLLQINNQ